MALSWMASKMPPTHFCICQQRPCHPIYSENIELLTAFFYFFSLIFSMIRQGRPERTRACIHLLSLSGCVFLKGQLAPHGIRIAVYSVATSVEWEPVFDSNCLTAVHVLVHKNKHIFLIYADILAFIEKSCQFCSLLRNELPVTFAIPDEPTFFHLPLEVFPYSTHMSTTFSYFTTGSSG